MPISSMLPELDLVDVSLHQYVSLGLRQHQTSVALVDGETGEQWTGAEVLSQSESFAAGLLLKLGVHKSDVILYVLPNCPRHAISILSTISIGAIVSGCNPVSTADEILRQIRDSNPVAIITDANGIGAVRTAVEMSHKDIKIIVVESTVPLRDSEYCMESLMDTPTSGLVLPEIDTKKDVCLMPYSSGTTGVPKGTLITHYNKVAQLQSINNPQFMSPVAGDSTIGILPFFHLFGLMVLFPCLKDGVALVTVRKFKPDLFFKHIQDYQVHVLYIVPPIVLALIKHPSVSNYDLSPLHTIVIGAAPLGEKLAKDLCARHPNIKYLMQGWGMTELTGAATLMPHTPMDQLRYASCGILVANSQAKIVDPETAKELGVNEDGEICWRGAGVMKGYFNKPDQTAATIDEQGWVHTGDVGHYDADGYFYIVDRLKELIKVNAYQVAPAELEDYLLDLSEVADAAVVGVPDEKAGELPVAFVVRKSGVTVDADHILQSINDKVAPYKRLKAVLFRDEIPKSASGKILRRVLREQVNLST